MRVRQINGKVAAIGIAIAIGSVFAAPAEARFRGSHAAHASAGYGYASHSSLRGHLLSRFASRSYEGGGRLQCVPFARENTGIELAGNAATWWNGADGVYQRGARPEVGSVLNFRANGRMRMGHVAVVSNVVDARNIEIDHANWSGPGAGAGGISRNITVVDVSPGNDWTAVRVALGHTGEFGSVYPTYGFIYDRPDTGTLLANSAHAPAPTLNAAPRDLRPVADRMEVATATEESEEVAEASDDLPRSSSSHRVERFAGHYGSRAGFRSARGYASRHDGFERYATAHYAASRYGSPRYAAERVDHADRYGRGRGGLVQMTEARGSRAAGHVGVTRVQSHTAIATHSHRRT